MVYLFFYFFFATLSWFGGICLGPKLDICWMCVGHVGEMIGTYSGSVCDMLGYVWDMFGPSLEHVYDMVGICLGYII